MICVLAGRRIDEPGQLPPRFPVKSVPVVRERIRKLFRKLAPTHLVCSAACGADLVALEIAEDLKVPFTIVLPFGEKMFKKLSVVDRPGDWSTSFDLVIGKARKESRLLVVGETASPDAFLLANYKILELGARLGNDKATGIAVWEGQPKQRDDATKDFIDQVQSRGWPLLEVSTL